jgi:uncharacterized delta-60 repeat protein
MHPIVAPLRAAHVSTFTAFAKATSARSWLIGLFAVCFWLAGGAPAAQAQSALDGFDPNANGTIYAVVVQPDGKVLIGGTFGTVSGVTRNGIARLNPDGTLDTAFNPNASGGGGVFAIAVQADGKILVGGQFSGANSIGGQTRNRIARLDATTGLADSWDPNANGTAVFAIAVQADGKILAGGTFSGANSIGGQTRNYIARLDAATGLADSWDPNANLTVNTIAVQADGKILVGGSFAGPGSIGGQTRNRIARVDATTGLADSFNPSANFDVFSIAVQADGRVLAGGDFTSIGGQTRNFIARLDAISGAADLTFDPSPNGAAVFSIAVQADGKILAGGNFSNIGGQTRNSIARLDATTGLADSFDPNANETIRSIAVQADGKILAGGAFTGLAPNGGAGVTRNFIARLETDGRLDRTLNLSIVGLRVFATAVQPDGKFLIGGTFTTVLGVARNNIARLNTDGTLDTAFNPNANGIVDSIAVQPDGKILVGGFFNVSLGANTIGGQTRNFIARLDATTGLADSFNPNANTVVRAIAVQSDGKILVGGDFNGPSSIGGATRNYIARLDATTGAADSFDPNANFSVLSIVVQADSKILAGGDFNSEISTPTIGGATRNYIARLDATTGLADSFDPNADNIVFSIAVQADGRVLAGGSFASIGGATRTGIARLDATTGAADSFDPNADPFTTVLSIAVQADGKILAGGQFFGNIGGATRNGIARLDPTTGLADSFDPNANNNVNSIAVQADGKILAGGEFTGIGGQTRNRFARLSNDTAALQNLAATQTTISWTRGGSSPQFTRVTFEYSTDNVNYSSLGNGTAAGSNWTRAGLNLSTGKNIYLRARGYYRSGYQNGSESIAESVRNAFLSGPTAANGNIGGQITDNSGAPISGVAITLSGTQSREAITDSNGNYRFDSVETNGFYTVTPERANYSFSPANRSFSLLGVQTEASFTATANGDRLNAIDTTEFFVRQQYLDFLGREPDPPGFNGWVNTINNCAPGDASCDRVHVSEMFFRSEEFQQRGYFVYRFYSTAFGQKPDYAAFGTDLQRVSGFLTNDQLEAAKTAFANDFVTRPAFAAQYGSLSNSAYVDALVNTAAVNLSNRQSIIDGLNAGTLTRAQALRQIAESGEVYQRYYNQAFVVMEYFGYLRRDPDLLYLNWIDVLSQGGDSRRMVEGFVDANEYRNRFKQ